MDIRVTELAIPAKVDWNYDEIKGSVTALSKKYSNMVYTDDDVKAAKDDRAALNKLKKALNDERLKREREYMAPFNEFKAQVNEIIKIIDEPVKMIDTQVKAYQEKKKEEKRIEVQELVAEAGIPVMVECFWNPKWLNEGTSKASIKKELQAIADKVQGDYTAIQSQLGENYAAVAMEKYQETMDLGAAFAKAKEMADYDEMKRRKEEEIELEAVAVAMVEEEQTPDVTSVIEEAPTVVTTAEEDIPEEFMNMGNNWDISAKWRTLEVRIDGGQEYALQSFLARNGIDYRWA